MSEQGHRVCFKIAIDPSTPLSSLLEAPTIDGVEKPVTVAPSTMTSEALRACKGCSAIVAVDGDGKLVKAVGSDRAALYYIERGDVPVGELPGEAPLLGLDDSVEKLVEELILHGGPVVVVDRLSRPIYVVNRLILSRLLQEEVDIEEVRAAD